jgi:putative ABC transport system permease protein
MSYQGFVWKNGTRNKRRAILTMLSIALAMFVLSTLVGALREIERGSEETSPLRLITRHAISLANPLPMRYRAQIEKIPGVVAVTPFNWIGGIYIDQAHTDFAQFSCDAGILFEVYNEIKIPSEQKEAFIKERTAVVVGQRKAVKHGWKLGDRITIKGVIYPVDLELTVRGIFTGTPNQESSIFLHHEYLMEAVRQAFGPEGFAGTYWIRVDSADSVSRVSEAIDSMYLNSDAPTKTETEKAFNLSFVSMLGNLRTFVGALSGMIIFTILLVTGNTMAMSVRERIREIAVLKSLGFRRGKVLGLLMSEGVFITVGGGLIGCLGARLFFSSLDLAALSQGFFQQLTITWGIIALALGVSAVMGLVSAGIPALRAAGLTVADGLRHVG